MQGCRQQPAGRIGSTLPPVRRLARCRRRGVRATCILDPLTRETRNGTGKEEACRQENHFCQAGQEDGKWQKAPQVRRHPAAEGGVPNFDASRGLTTLASKSRPAASAWRDLRFAARRLDRSSGAMRNQEAGRAQPGRGEQSRTRTVQWTVCARQTPTAQALGTSRAERPVGLRCLTFLRSRTPKVEQSLAVLRYVCRVKLDWASSATTAPRRWLGKACKTGSQFVRARAVDAEREAVRSLDRSSGAPRRRDERIARPPVGQQSYLDVGETGSL